MVLAVYVPALKALSGGVLPVSAVLSSSEVILNVKVISVFPLRRRRRSD
jgi:hypothetical protein